MVTWRCHCLQKYTGISKEHTHILLFWCIGGNFFQSELVQNCWTCLQISDNTSMNIVLPEA